MNLQDDIMDTSQLHLTGDFDSQVTYLLDNVRLTRSEVEHLGNLFNDLQRTLNNVWPNCKVHPFGSIVTGLGIRTSDVDCYVSRPPWDHIPADKVVMKAKRILASQFTLFTELFAIPMAKVPIVKFFHIPTGRHCDVNFKSPSGVENSNLVAYLLHTDPRVLPLAILIKYWAKIHNLTGTNLLSNYSLTMLVIFYLQQIDVLPPVSVLQRSVPCCIIENWNTAFEETNYTANNEDSLYQLMGRFFNYYSNFDFDTQIISPFLGYPINRNLFKNFHLVPEEFNLYKKNIINKVCQQLKTDSKLCIQDPFEHCRNCAVSVFPKLAKKLLSCFKMASTKFRESTNEMFLKQILTSVEKGQQVKAVSRKKKTHGQVAKRKSFDMKHEFKKVQNNVHVMYANYNRLKNKRPS